MVPSSACRHCLLHDRPSLAARPETRAGAYTTSMDATARSGARAPRRVPRIPRRFTKSQQNGAGCSRLVQAAQSVTIRPGTRSNSRRLSVTRAARRRRACAAMR